MYSAQGHFYEYFTTTPATSTTSTTSTTLPQTSAPKTSSTPPPQQIKTDAQFDDVMTIKKNRQANRMDVTISSGNALCIGKECIGEGYLGRLLDFIRKNKDLKP